MIMEKESLKVMNEMLLHIQLQDEELGTWVEAEIKRILTIEGLAKVKNKKFDLRDITKSEKNTKYRTTRGIMHEGGFKIATDGRILAAVKTDYPDELEGKNIDPKNGEEITYRKYPNYKLIATPNRFTVPVNINLDAVKTVEQKVMLDKKLGQVKLYYYCKIGETYYDISLVKILARFMRAYSLTKIKQEKGNDMSMAYTEAPDGSYCIICPMSRAEEYIKEATDCTA